MLFILTGGVQIGKTRWLERLVDDLAHENVTCFGVLAPGVWRIAEDGAASGQRGSVGVREKIGIDNVLLPHGERIPFAMRRDLLEGGADGADAPSGMDAEPLMPERTDSGETPDSSQSAYRGARKTAESALTIGSDARMAADRKATSQSDKAQIGWAIYDDALDRVNAHFEALPEEYSRSDAESEARTAVVPGVASAFEVEPGAGSARESESETNSAPTLLVIDEIGRLELQNGRGLTAAMHVLDKGPTSKRPHALVVVRDWLVPDAQQRFEAVWGKPIVIGPDEIGREAVRAAFGLPCNQTV